MNDLSASVPWVSAWFHEGRDVFYFEIVDLFLVVNKLVSGTPVAMVFTLVID